jgi:cell division septum initiation protein DivIVA
MTKQNEIDILRAAANQLGADSYCGPWLSQQIPAIEKEIRSDYNPTADFNATQRDCAQAKENAEAWAKDKLEAAERVAKEIIADARKEATAITSRVVSEMRQASKKLGYDW